jgi:hypothetical protein
MSAVWAMLTQPHGTSGADGRDLDSRRSSEQLTIEQLLLLQLLLLLL